MTRNTSRIAWAKIIYVLLFAAATSAASFAQTDVEIEIAGPWSYVQDPADSSRVVVVVPNVGHVMAVFTGEDAANYTAAPAQPLGPHRLDFVTLSCGATPSPSSYFLYAANGVSLQNIKDVAASPSAYSISLPKPCSYETRLESVFKYDGIRPVTGSDAERSFTTWMTLHYKVAATTKDASLDNGNGKPPNVPFGSNTGSTIKAISVIVHLDTAPDTKCDSHSAAAFDSTLTLWNLPRVYRVFPQLIDLVYSNQQQLGTYNSGCTQTYNTSSTGMSDSNQAKVKHATKPIVTSKQKPRVPGRADCHAPQVNVNGVVN